MDRSGYWQAGIKLSGERPAPRLPRAVGRIGRRRVRGREREVVLGGLPRPQVGGEHGRVGQRTAFVSGWRRTRRVLDCRQMQYALLRTYISRNAYTLRPTITFLHRPIWLRAGYRMEVKRCSTHNPTRAVSAYAF
jgi:hypothetical protein